MQDFIIKVIMALVFGVKRHWQILFAIILGFGFGLLFYNNQLSLDPKGQMVLSTANFVGEVFIRLISMIALPLVISSLIVGVSSLKDARQLGRMGGKVFSFFLLFMILAALIGGGLTQVFTPGQDMEETIEQISKAIPHHEKIANINTLQNERNIDEMVLDLIPKNPVQAVSTDNLFPAILFTLLLGFSMAFIGQAAKPLLAFFESLFTASMKMTDWVMTLAVPGVFALAFFAVGSAGPGMLTGMLPYIGVVICGLLLQVVVVFPLMLWLLARVDAISLYRAVSEAILVAFGTASSSATLPITIANCEYRAGISNRIASFVLPTGASINKTATTMFEVVAVLFLVQAYNIDIEPATVGLIMVLSIIASIAAAGVPSAGMITMSIIITSIWKGDVIQSLTAGIAVLWAIDRVLDMFRTVTNVISSVTVATIVAASEGELKRDVLNNPDAWRTIIE